MSGRSIPCINDKRNSFRPIHMSATSNAESDSDRPNSFPPFDSPHKARLQYISPQQTTSRSFLQTEVDADGRRQCNARSLCFFQSRTRWSVEETQGQTKKGKPQTEASTKVVTNGYNVLAKRWHNSIHDKVLIFGLGDTRLALIVYPRHLQKNR